MTLEREVAKAHLDLWGVGCGQHLGGKWGGWVTPLSFVADYEFTLGVVHDCVEDQALRELLAREFECRVVRGQGHITLYLESGQPLRWMNLFGLCEVEEFELGEYGDKLKAAIREAQLFWARNLLNMFLTLYDPGTLGQVAGVPGWKYIFDLGYQRPRTEQEALTVQNRIRAQLRPRTPAEIHLFCNWLDYRRPELQDQVDRSNLLGGGPRADYNQLWDEYLNGHKDTNYFLELLCPTPRAEDQS